MAKKRKPYYRFVIDRRSDNWYWWRLNRGATIIAVSHTNFKTRKAARNEVERLKTNLVKAEVDEVLE